MSWLAALAGRARWSDGATILMQGDALATLRDIPHDSVDLVLADPPYSSGGAFRGDRTQSTAAKYISSDSTRKEIADFAGDVRDQRSYFAWSTLWLGEALRVLKHGRVCAVFTDWRQLPTTTDALQAAGFVWRGVAVWDKGNGRPLLGITNGHAEYLVWGSKGAVNLGDGYEVRLPTILRARIERSERELHQTAKPVALLERLVSLAPRGGVVVDPFTGSGSVLVAARRSGRRGVGVELTPEYAATAEARLQREASQLDLFGGDS